jgi:hypothetical protein
VSTVTTSGASGTGPAKGWGVGLSIGSRLGSYEIQSPLGAGSIGGLEDTYNNADEATRARMRENNLLFAKFLTLEWCTRERLLTLVFRMTCLSTPLHSVQKPTPAGSGRCKGALQLQQDERWESESRAPAGACGRNASPSSTGKPKQARRQ